MSRYCPYVHILWIELWLLRPYVVFNWIGAFPVPVADAIEKTRAYQQATKAAFGVCRWALCRCRKGRWRCRCRSSRTRPAWARSSTCRWSSRPDRTPRCSAASSRTATTATGGRRRRPDRWRRLPCLPDCWSRPSNQIRSSFCGKTGPLVTATERTLHAA